MQIDYFDPTPPKNLSSLIFHESFQPEFIQTAVTVALDDCYWAMNGLKRGHDRK